ncbi:hypothetical protein CEXT_699571 [Caerostris extrusa]|uniref:Uncharacterized protein n=1 Tax=Caerostris extrusa TaxID=172846 RepID=A0AAV4TUL2_CAEEX|nr:hypothetical protein CEXT_699571 [Caerostris extrusa]
MSLHRNLMELERSLSGVKSRDEEHFPSQLPKELLYERRSCIPFLSGVLFLYNGHSDNVCYFQIDNQPAENFSWLSPLQHANIHVQQFSLKVLSGDNTLPYLLIDYIDYVQYDMFAIYIGGKPDELYFHLDADGPHNSLMDGSNSSPRHKTKLLLFGGFVLCRHQSHVAGVKVQAAGVKESV